ncbi:hypothetical protein [Spiroplasma endosymbiont of Cantharis lateralis]|uniref:hypothetical protein n=1 Tax=Spiroplasma endosymbiont of Cantharis lateralis TaxID=3066277 RepID=UPI00313C27AC
MIKLLGLIGSLSLSTSAVTPVLNINLNNKNITQKTYGNIHIEKAIDLTMSTFKRSAVPIFSQSSIEHKLVYIRATYGSISSIYEILNNAPHPSEIVLAKQMLLLASEDYDRAARQGQAEVMMHHAQVGLFRLITAFDYMHKANFNINKEQGKLGNIHIEKAIDLTMSTFERSAVPIFSQSSIEHKLVYIRATYGNISSFYELLNNAPHPSEIVLAKQMLLLASEDYDRAARQGQAEVMMHHAQVGLFRLITAFDYMHKANSVV